MDDGLSNPAIGPHEGRELELMLAGKKPLAMFMMSFPLLLNCQKPILHLMSTPDES